MTRDAVAVKGPDIDEFKYLQFSNVASFQPRFDQVAETSRPAQSRDGHATDDQAPKTSSDERFSAEAWGKAMWQGLVDKGVREPVRGVLTIPGIHEAVTFTTRGICSEYKVRWGRDSADS